MMMLREAAQAVQGELVGEDSLFTSVSSDSRVPCTGALFVALRGAHFDGNEFVAQAHKQGAVGALVDVKPGPENTLPYIKVADTTAALGQLAQYWRAKIPALRIAVTGSCGKTSVKGMLAEIFRGAGATQATQGNLNNHIGVPLTLLALAHTTEYAIIEAGTSNPGEIAYLADLIQPDIALLNNVHAAHLQGFGSLDAIAAEKSALYRPISNHKPTRIINTDLLIYDCVRDLLKETQTCVLFTPQASDYSAPLNPEQGHVYAEQVRVFADSVNFILCCGSERTSIALSVPGTHQVDNALAAAACARAAGLPFSAIAQGLAAFSGVSGRMQRFRYGDANIIDDSYNANPGSMRAAIDYLRLQKNSILVLGDMGELGAYAEQAHRDVGRYAAEAGIHSLYVIGQYAALYAHAFGENARVFDDIGTLVDALKQQLRQMSATVLIKGSRSSRMDRVCQSLKVTEEHV